MSKKDLRTKLLQVHYNKKFRKCGSCNGKGHYGKEKRFCVVCNGTGRLPLPSEK